MTLTEFKLPRTGNVPVRFTGELIAEATSRKDGKPNADGTPRPSKQWYEASIYRTQGGGFVVAATYRTDWAHETEYRWADPVESTAAAVKWLQGLDVICVVAGYPDVPRFKPQQDRLLDSLQDQWDWLVGELLAKCDEFAEVVE